MIIPKQVS